MGAAEDQLLTPAYWQSRSPDLRLNPLVRLESETLETYLEASEVLQGHVIFATSGSGGQPKMVALSKDALLASAKAVNAHLQVSTKDKWLSALPTFHVGGFGVWARAYTAGNAVVPFTGKWRAERFVKLCQDEEVTLTSLVPVQVYDLVKAAARAPESLRAVIVGGGKLATELGQEARELGWPVLQSYGMTETASQVATQNLDSLDHAFENEDLPLISPWKARATEDGRLELCGPGLFFGYLTKAESGWHFERGAVQTEGDGEEWFSTEDQGEVETTANGQVLRVQGRRGRMIKILGELVCLDGLESRLARVAGLDAPFLTLHAMPDARNGHRILLVTESRVSPQRAHDILKRFNAEVAPFEKADAVVRIEGIPRSSLGKIRRDALARLVAEQTSA